MVMTMVTAELPQNYLYLHKTCVIAQLGKCYDQIKCNSSWVAKLQLTDSSTFNLSNGWCFLKRTGMKILFKAGMFGLQNNVSSFGFENESRTLTTSF